MTYTPKATPIKPSDIYPEYIIQNFFLGIMTAKFYIVAFRPPEKEDLFITCTNGCIETSNYEYTSKMPRFIVKSKLSFTDVWE